MTMPWQNPPQASFEFGLADHVGTLGFFIVGGTHENIWTSFGEKTGVRVSIVFLDGPEAGKEFTDILLFNNRPVARLRNAPGGIILARIGYGEAKGGANKPVELYDATDQDRALAMSYHTAFPQKLEQLRQATLAAYQQAEKKAQQGGGRVQSQPHPTHAGSQAPANNGGQWGQQAQPQQPHNQQGWNQPAANAMATQPAPQPAHATPAPWQQQGTVQNDAPPF